MTNHSKPTLSAVKLALAARDARASIRQPELLAADPVAIVGMSCRFPDGANTPDEFWRLLVEARDGIQQVPPDRWDVDAFFDPDGTTPGKMNTRYGGFISQPFDAFEPAFFGIAPREAAAMDPQQRLLLEVAWEALDDSGCTQERLAGSATGVFLSIYSNDYGQQLYSERLSVDAYTAVGVSHSIAAGRLSFLLDLRGPSLVVDTACSSSLVAVHLACQSLRSGECRMALAGGVSLLLTPDRGISLSKWGFMAPDGRCKPFDAAADGWVRGEGAGIIVMKRLVDALADGDRVLAVVRGTAVNQDGRSSVLTAPNGLAQEAVVRAALQSGLVAAEDVTFVEAHGTGTSIGDPIELEALAQVLGGPATGRPCWVGAVKSNIGHLEAAAGIAGVVKSVLALRARTIPPTLHFKTINPLVSLAGTRLRIPTATEPWDAAGGRRFAGVSAFGFGGTNAHVVLEEAPVVPSTPAPVDGAIYVLPLSARSAEALPDLSRAYASVLRRDDATALRLVDVCFTAAERRTHHDHRLVVIGHTRDALVDALDAAASGVHRPDVIRGRRRPRRRSQAVFVFSGQGPQWWGMARELLDAEPVFRTTVEEIAAAFARLSSWSLIDELRADQHASRLERTEVAQPAIFAVQAGLTALLASWGIHPAAIVGHSVGEIAAAYAAGVLDLASAVRVVFHRGRVMQEGTGLGRMAALGLSPAEARQAMDQATGQLALAAINAPRSVTITGDADAIQRVVDAVQTTGVFARTLPVDYAFHSEQMAPFAQALASELGGLATRVPRIPVVSTVTGQLAGPGDFDAAYWARNVRQTVQFWAAIETLLGDGHATFVELAPDPVLGPSLRRGFADRADDEVLVLATLQRDRPAAVALRATAASLHASGCTVSWSDIVPKGGSVVSLPAYPWQRQRYRVEVGDFRVGATAPRPPPVDADIFPGRRLRSPELAATVFDCEISIDQPAFARDHCVHGASVYPATALLQIARTAFARLPGVDPDTVVLSEVQILDPVVLSSEPRALQILIENGRTFRIVGSATTGDVWSTHVTGSAAAKSAVSTVAGDEPRGDIRRRCTERIDRADWYADLEEHGFAFGPTFQTIDVVQRREGEAIADVRLSIPRESADENDVLLLDGCLQAIWAALPDRVRQDGSGDAFVPIAFGHVSVIGRLTGRLVSHVRVDGESGGRDAFVARLVVHDERGSVVARLEATVARATRGALLRATRRAVAEWLYDVEWKRIDVATPALVGHAANAETPWLFVADRGGLASRLASSLDQRGGRALVVSPENLSESGADLLAGPQQIVRVVDCRPLDLTVDSSISSSELARAHERLLTGTLTLAQTLAAAVGRVAGLLLVTRGAQTIGSSPSDNALAQSPILGLSRSLRLEHPELHVTTIDLDPSAPDDEASIHRLLRSFPDGSVHEDELALRSGGWHAPRLVARPAVAATRALAKRLESSQRGTLERLSVRQLARRAPGRGEIAIDVEAAGLNFRDVLNALGMYPGDPGPLGHECAGTIAALGAGVDRWRVGDPVVAVAPASLASYVIAPASLVVHRPAGLTALAAATLPIAFMTARYALETLATIRRGDRVLIHAAAGGVGLAAVQIAQRLGAELFATAGSERKHEVLRGLGVRHVMSSRTLEFADTIRALTEGRGVDLVLNSLTGEFIPRSLDLLTPGGSFVEIGKIGIWETAAVAARRPDVRYRVLYLGDVIDRSPEVGQSLLAGIVDDVASGALSPLPVHAFPLEQSAEAFRFMAQARHIGKIVLTMAAAPARAVRPDGTYLITGGLGALGLETAAGLARAGARHLMLAGRRAPDAAAEARIGVLRAAGVNVTVAQSDVSREGDVRALIGEIASTMPRLVGVLHAAGIVDDGVIGQQTWERFAPVMAAKATGAWNLHVATRGMPLDCFVMFSSMAGLLGSPGQSNYAAANSFLDALAGVRRRLGLHALAIQWGAWSGRGMAATLGSVERHRWAALGVEEIEPAAGVDLMIDAMCGDPTTLAVTPMSWPRYATGFPGGRVPRLVSDLTGADGPRRLEGSQRIGAVPLHERVSAAVVNRRLPMLVRFVTEQALETLGLPATYALDPHQGLRDVGLDSLMAIELRNRLQEAVRHSLPTTVAFDYPTAAALAEYLGARVLGLTMRSAAPASLDADAAATDVSSLSDDEAESQLRRELAELDRNRTALT